jgi:glutamine amidotransferase
MIENDNLLACQFHPEKSGITGEKLLRRWLSNIQ